MTNFPEKSDTSSLSYSRVSVEPDPQKVVGIKTKEAVRPHGKVSLEDFDWIRTQPPSVHQLWLDCMAAEQFGKQLRKLETKLCKKFFRRAKAALEERGLFYFEPIVQVLPSGQTKIVGWKVENLHGYYHKDYWEIQPTEQIESQGQIVTTFETNCHHLENKLSPPSRQIVTTFSPNPTPSKDSKIVNHVSTTHQLPTKVVGGVVSIPSEETELPFEGAVPKDDGMPEEESPAVTDCTTASSVQQEVNVESCASLPDQTELASQERQDLYQDQCSAAAAIEQIRAKLGIKAPARVTEVSEVVSMSPEEKAKHEADTRALAAQWLTEASYTAPPEEDPWTS